MTVEPRARGPWIYDRQPMPYWSTERVTLLGDAAHPMVAGRFYRSENEDVSEQNRRMGKWMSAVGWIFQYDVEREVAALLQNSVEK